MGYVQVEVVVQFFGELIPSGLLEYIYLCASWGLTNSTGPGVRIVTIKARWSLL